MKIILLRQNRIDGQAGDIVDVSPVRADFLIRYGIGLSASGRELPQNPEDAIQMENPEAEPKETPEKPKRKETSKAVRKGK